MDIVRKVIIFLKKIGLLRTYGASGSYKSSKDKAYQPPDPQNS